MNPLILPAVLDNYTNRKDKSVALKFVTQELTAAQVADLHQRIDHFGVLYFKNEKGISDAELKKLEDMDVDVYDQPKSSSQRLRSVMYVLWEQEGKEGDFKDFYTSKMNTIVQHFKDKLEPR